MNTVANTMPIIEPRKLHVFDQDDARVSCEDGLSVATLRPSHHAGVLSAGLKDSQTFMLNHLKSILGDINSN